jgi:hypothetical protein
MDDRGIDNVTGSEEFERLTGVLNDGALCLMLSIGHQTGLFDTMAVPAQYIGLLALSLIQSGGLRNLRRRRRGQGSHGVEQSCLVPDAEHQAECTVV